MFEFPAVADAAQEHTWHFWVGDEAFMAAERIPGEDRTCSVPMVGSWERLSFCCWRYPSAVIRAEAGLLGQGFWALGLLLPLLAAAGGIVALAFEPLANRYGYLPAEAGQSIVLRVSTSQGNIDRYHLYIAEQDARITAAARVNAAKSAWFAVTPLRQGLLRIALEGEEGQQMFFLNVGRPDVPALRHQQVEGAAIDISYRPVVLWGMPQSWLAVASAVSLIAAFPLGLLLSVVKRQTIGRRSRADAA